MQCTLLIMQKNDDKIDDEVTLKPKINFSITFFFSYSFSIVFFLSTLSSFVVLLYYSFCAFFLLPMRIEAIGFYLPHYYLLMFVVIFSTIKLLLLLHSPDPFPILPLSFHYYISSILGPIATYLNG